MTVHSDAQVRHIAATANIEVLNRALDLYKQQVGNFPPSFQELRPYLREDVPRDPWGRPFLYRADGQNRPEILSLGADGKPGGRGDDQDLSSFHLHDLIRPSAADYWREIVPWIALGCLVGCPFLAWRGFRRTRIKGDYARLPG